MAPSIRLDWLRQHVRFFFFIACAILTSIAVSAYISHERYIYFWDYALYWNFFRDAVSLLETDWRTLTERTVRSINDWDYNYLPILPLTPFGLIWGDSRLTYVLGIVNVLVIPTALLAAVAMASLMPQTTTIKQTLTLIVGSLLFLILHPVWVPVLEGRPDVAGLAAVFGTLAIYFKRSIIEQSIGGLILIGVLLAFAFLARRWYVYWMVAFFPSAFIAEWFRQTQSIPKYFAAKLIGKLGVIALALSVVVFLSAWKMLLRIFAEDYSDSYSAYKITGGIGEAFLLASQYFGVSVVIGSGLGLVFLSFRKHTRFAPIFLVMQSLLCVLIFYRVQDFNAHHYYLFLPIIFIGLSALFLELLQRTQAALFSRILAAVIAAVIAVSSVSVFSRTLNLSIPHDLQWILPQVTRFPNARNDFDELQALLRDLNHRSEAEHGTVYVIGSSTVFNDDILRNLCRSKTPEFLVCNDILRASHVDKRDGFPVGIITSRFVVSSTPAQYHLRPEDQKVVGLLTRDFMKSSGIAQAFAPVGRVYSLDNGVSIQVYEKTKSVSDESVDTLSVEFMSAYPDHATLFSVQR